MKANFLRLTAATVLTACIASSVACYPAYGPRNYNTAYNQDSKGYDVQQEPAPQPRPRYVGVDPGLVVAGVAAAGILGYAIGNNRHHGYYGPRYYAPVGYGYYGPRYCR